MKKFLKVLSILTVIFTITITLTHAQQQAQPSVEKMKVDKKPEFPGGKTALINFLSKQVKYPESAKKALLEGSVSVGFKIQADGSITDVKVRATKYTIRKMDEKTKQMTAVSTNNPTDKSLEMEAIRVIKTMPHWKAAEYQGTKVAVDYALPITFTLQ